MSTSVEVSEIVPQFLRHVFAFKKFNRMQQECIPLLSSGSSCLITAPPRSGKTCLLEFSICQEIANAFKASESSIYVPQRRIVYLAPVSSLCHAVWQKWSANFESLGVNVVELLDAELSQDAFSTGHIVVTTPDKLEILTRCHSSGASPELRFVSSIGLLLVDEVHHLVESRGVSLEIAISRLKLLAAAAQEDQRKAFLNFQIVAVSAAVPNITCVSSWLNTDRRLAYKSFSESYRMVPVELSVLGFQVRNRWKFDQLLDFHLSKVVKSYGDGLPTLVFCTSRASATRSALSFQNCRQHRDHDNSALHTLQEFAKQCQPPNSILLSRRLGVHHAGISVTERKQMETLFRQGLIKTLFTTTALGPGMNLPAQLVVLKGTSTYMNGGFVELGHANRNLVLQIIGLCGRPPQDKKGNCVILTETTKVSLYQGLQNGLASKIDSHLLRSLPENLNAEIARGQVSSVDSALRWLQTTLAWHSAWEVSEEKKLAYGRSLVEVAFKELIDAGIVSGTDGNITPGPGCRAMARFSLSLTTMVLFRKRSHEVGSCSDVMKLVAETKEVLDSVFVRRAEKSVLNSANQYIRFPVTGKVKTASDKAVVLLQIVLGEKTSLLTEDPALIEEAEKICQDVARVSQGLATYLAEIDLADYSAAVAALTFSRGVIHREFWSGSHTLLQVQGIEASTQKALVRARVRSIADLVAIDRATLRAVLSKSAVEMKTIVKGLQKLPRFETKNFQVFYDTTHTRCLCIQGSVHVASHELACITAAERETEDAVLEHPVDINGFILIGGHGQYVYHYKEFHATPGSTIDIAISIPMTGLQQEWIDVLTGPRSYNGSDFHARIRIGKRGPLHAPVNEQSQSCRTDVDDMSDENTEDNDAAKMLESTTTRETPTWRGIPLRTPKALPASSRIMKQSNRDMSFTNQKSRLLSGVAREGAWAPPEVDGIQCFEETDQKNTDTTSSLKSDTGPEGNALRLLPDKAQTKSLETAKDESPSEKFAEVHKSLLNTLNFLREVDEGKIL